ncbi:MAG TPA: type II toxin-antitoxin system RelE/ParE family toxin [Chlamydiales bacterium]|nr:type II toxin-antitoxin system RelE/ParE family toxin [Chlamydiales bacterium]
MAKYKTASTLDFIEWLESLAPKHRIQVKDRIKRIEDDGHFGIYKDLKNGIYELKWEIGTRAYYVYMDPRKLLFLWGGNKNGQNKDIKKAKNILEKFLASHGSEES